ncbi:MAG: tripartite tricarboxylate transporter substrate binding protein [Proteobacteria bacterium]|nr:tripartite tricarboxylate transporter substrate binding protein [Pseudomonadota bacterium]
MGAPTLLRRLLPLLLAGCALALPGTPSAQDFPKHPIRLYVGFTPGTGIDVVARIVAAEASKSLAQPVIVENKAGAGGNIAGDATAKAAPDGYSLHWAAPGSAVINHHLNKSMPYAYKDLVPVSLVGIVPLVVIVPTQSPYKSLADLVAAAKANPGKLSYGTPGIGTSNHMATELFLYSAKIRATHVPYKGSAATQDLLAGNLDFIFDSITTATPFITSGKMRPLALTTAMRSPLLPDVATIAEQGYPGYEASNWYAVMAPHGTPAAIIQKLNAEFVKASRAPEVEKRMQSLGVIVVASSADELRKFVDAQYEAIGRVVREAGIRAE